MEKTSELLNTLLAWIPAIISIVVMVVNVLKYKPEKKKTEADTASSLAEGAESIANGAKISNEMLLERIKEGELRADKFEKDADRKINELTNLLRVERDARISLEVKLLNETAARLRAERLISALQEYIEELKALMRTKDLSPPPFDYVDD